MNDEEGYVMSWVSQLTQDIVFGPPPRNQADIKYLCDQHDVRHFINLVPRSASFTRVPEHVTKRSMKRAVPTSEAYLGYYDDDDDEARFPGQYHHHPFDATAIPPKGRLKEDQTKNLAVEYVRHAKKLVSIVKAGVSFIHSTDGFKDEAFMAFAIWALLKGPNMPNDILAWFAQTVNGESKKVIINRSVFNEDEQNMKLLAAIWAEARKPASPFDRGAK
jgi:hypothetical protein